MTTNDEDREREDNKRLDALLDQIPEPVPPPGLAASVLAATASEREAQARARRSRWPLRLVGPAALVAAAVAVAATAGLWGAEDDPLATDDGLGGEQLAQVDGPTEDSTDTGADAVVHQTNDDPSTEAAPPATGGSTAAVDEELLANLDLLEDWELLVTEDLDLVLSDLDDVDELLLSLPLADEEDEQG